MRPVLIVAAAALCLTACGKDKAPAAAPAQAAEGGDAAGPMRKSGLWEISRLRDGKAPEGGLASGPTKICTDAKAEGKMGLLGNRMTQAMCSKQTVSRNPDGSWTYASTCQMGPAGTTTTTGVVRGDLGTRYTVHSESDTTGSELARMNGHHVTDVTAAYEGPCPADMVPGDVLLANGMKINPEKLMAGAVSQQTAPKPQ
jgi:hypothetical protein